MNLVTDVMMNNPVVCTSDMRVAEIKYLLKKYDYDEMVVVDSYSEKHPLGLVSLTDMDSPEVMAVDLPSDISAMECMREIPAVVLDSSTIEECLNVMRANHMERIPVVDLNGHFEGMVEKKQIAKMIF